jgi:predicted heme/steroid binding protein
VNLPPGNKLFTEQELAEYNGVSDPNKLALAILGEVYDVSAGAKHYGPGKGYNFFCGIDGTRAFVTGEFNKEGLVPDVHGLTGEQMLGIEEWIRFYRKDYRLLGKLIGHYYGVDGNPTQNLKKASKAIDRAHEEKKKDDELKKLLPNCNSKFSSTEGKTLWCSDKSGGIDRDWVGVVREHTNPETKTKRCVCVPPELLNDPNLALYDGCPPDASECSWSAEALKAEEALKTVELERRKADQDKKLAQIEEEKRLKAERIAQQQRAAAEEKKPDL